MDNEQVVVNEEEEIIDAAPVSEETEDKDQKDVKDAKEPRDQHDSAKAAFRNKRRKKVCAFCADKIDYIDYKDINRIRKNLSERAKILPRRVTGTCARHQRQLTIAVKRARHLALIPYITD
ncbi:MAG: 30S ribosomal protein S18 [Clostridia bacterium]|nr:30S ribosomal protein S18 [Clostridia bacterium]